MYKKITSTCFELDYLKHIFPKVINTELLIKVLHVPNAKFKFVVCNQIMPTIALNLTLSKKHL